MALGSIVHKYIFIKLVSLIQIAGIRLLQFTQINVDNINLSYTSRILRKIMLQ